MSGKPPDKFDKSHGKKPFLHPAKPKKGKLPFFPTPRRRGIKITDPDSPTQEHIGTYPQNTGYFVPTFTPSFGPPLGSSFPHQSEYGAKILAHFQHLQNSPSQPIGGYSQNAQNPWSTPTQEISYSQVLQALKPEPLPQKMVADFFNPGIPKVFYDEINGAWKAHVTEQKKLFRKHLSSLSTLLGKFCLKQKEFQKLILEVIKQMNWNDDYDLEKINMFLEIAEYLEPPYSDDCIFNKIKRICLFEKSRQILPVDLFNQIKTICEEEQYTAFNNILTQYYERLFENKYKHLRLCFYLELYPWDETAFSWGLVSRVYFKNTSADLINHFPNMIKAMLYHVAGTWKFDNYLELNIFGTLGWRRRERFYGPYQIWALTRPSDIDLVGPLQLEADEALTLARQIKGDQFFINSIVELHDAAKFAQLFDFQITDGQRVFCTNMQINYQITPQQTLEAHQRLEQFITLNDLDLPFEYIIEAEEILDHRQLERRYLNLDTDDSYMSSPDSGPSTGGTR